MRNSIAILSLVLMSAPALAQEKAVSVSGDIRYRVQRDINMPSSGATENTRQRIRARVLMTGKINDSMTANVGLTTGAAETVASARGANADLAGFGSRKVVAFDRLNIDYKVMDGLNLMFGKTASPYWAAGGNPMVFSADTSFDGFAAKYSMAMDSLTPFVNLGYTSLRDQANGGPSSGPDFAMFGAQLGVMWKTEGMSAAVALNSFNYNNIKGMNLSAAGFGTNSYGNTTDTGNFANDFSLLGAGLEFGMDLGFAPMTAFGEYVQNSGPSKKNVAAIGGVRLGSTSKMGGWMVGYSYRDVAADSIFGVSADNTFLVNGTTDSWGHTVNAGYAFMDSAWLSLNYTAGDASGVSQESLKLDLNAKF